MRHETKHVPKLSAIFVFLLIRSVTASFFFFFFFCGSAVFEVLAPQGRRQRVQGLRDGSPVGRRVRGVERRQGVVRVPTTPLCLQPATDAPAAATAAF